MEKFFVYADKLTVGAFIEILQKLPKDWRIKAAGKRDFDDYDCYFNFDMLESTVVLSSSNMCYGEVFLEDLDEDCFCDEDEEEEY